MNQARLISLARPSGRQSARTVVWILSLVLSILFNVSSVAESLAHDSHAHLSSVEISESSPNSKPDAHGSHQAMHGKKAHNSHDVGMQFSDAGAHAESASENYVQTHLDTSTDPQSGVGVSAHFNNLDAECACDDICCLSAVSLNQVTSSIHSPLAESNLASQVRDYCSITLDLLLPPPNFS